MYELNQVSGNSYYIQSPAKIGLVRLNGTDVCLIDSGNDKEAGRKVRQLLDQNGWRLTAIYNTHSNADHIGGNQYLQNQTGCKVYAPGIECDLTRHPLLEPAFLYGGYPPKDLRHKFLMAKPSDAQELTAACLPEGFEQLPLPGHCLSSRETLEKYQIGFLYDVAAYLNTLETVKALRARAFVPAHAAVTEDIVPLAQYNIDKVLETADIITELCRTPQTFESVLQQLFRRFDLVMDFEQYALVGSTVRSYLAWGKDTGRLQVIFDDHRLLWQQA